MTNIIRSAVVLWKRCWYHRVTFRLPSCGRLGCESLFSSTLEVCEPSPRRHAGL